MRQTGPHRGAIGGAADEAGAEFRAAVAAWFVAHGLAGEGVPGLDRRAGPVPLAVALETDHPVDDIEVQFDDGSRVFIQAKRTLGVTARSNSAFGSAVDQLRQQYLAGGLRAQTDRLVLAVGQMTGPLRNLRSAFERARKPLAGSPSSGEAKALEHFRAHLGKMDEAQVQALLELCVVLEVQVERDDSAHTLFGIEKLKSALADPGQARAAWNEIARVGRRLAARRYGNVHEEWQRDLVSAGFGLAEDQGKPNAQSEEPRPPQASASEDVGRSTSLRAVRGLLENAAGPDPIFLLGAGASLKSGIPTAGDMSELMAKWAFCRSQGRDFSDQTVQRSDWVQFVQGRGLVQADEWPHERFPRFYREVLVPPEERLRFFKEMNRTRMSLSAGYGALAQLVGGGRLKTILTTNFDELAYEACRALPASATVAVARNPGDAHLISTAPVDPQLIYLHGDVQHFSLKNDDFDTAIAPEFMAVLPALLRDHPLVVVGYRGDQDSVLALFRRAARRSLRHGIYWLCLDPTNTPSRLRDFADELGTSFTWVKIRGFDEALRELSSGLTPLQATQSPILRTTPADMRPAALPLEDLDWSLIRRWVPSAASRLMLAGQGAPSREWLVNAMHALRLVSFGDDGQCDVNRACELLFAKNRPTRIAVVAGGTRSVLEGNILDLFEKLVETLNEHNEPYRLKALVSEDVRPFPALALKELLVNVLAHRDYGASEDSEVTIHHDRVEFRNPGGVVDTIDPEALGRRQVKGYRNPAVANFLFGTGHMDKLGSGLVDVSRWARENGGEASFSADAARFTATLTARPDRPTLTSDRAVQVGDPEVFYANALDVDFPGGVIFQARTRLTTRRAVFDRVSGQTAPFVVNGYRLRTLADLRSSNNPLAGVIYGTVEERPIAAYSEDPELQRMLVDMLNESLARHAKDRGLLVDRRNQRLYYPKDSDGADRQVAYQARTKRATRTVVKARTNNSGDVRYYEHTAVRWQFRRLGGQWRLLLLPGWVFTRDGHAQRLARERINSLSTKRSAREYNPQVVAHVFFWGSVLSENASTSLLDDGSGGCVRLYRVPMSLSLPNAPKARGFERESSEDDLELERLDDELARIAAAETEGEDE